MLPSRSRRERAYRAGYRDGMAEGQNPIFPFKGIPQIGFVTTGAKFTFERSWPESFIAYERAVLEQLRRVEEARVINVDAQSNDYKAALERLQNDIERELRFVREAVDGEVRLSHLEKYVVDALRALSFRPEGVREYQTVEEFVAEDHRRGGYSQPGDLILFGAVYGSRWRLENPIARWNTTEWEVGLLGHGDGSAEVYAVEHFRTGGSHPRFGTGRVWLLATPRNVGVARDWLEESERNTQQERNSLVALATRLAHPACRNTVEADVDE